MDSAMLQRFPVLRRAKDRGEDIRIQFKTQDIKDQAQPHNES